MMIDLRIKNRQWPGPAIRIILIIVIIAAVARWQPGEVLPLITGTSLGCWLFAGQPATRMVTS